MTDFVHLHLHTEYSLLDGACRINRLFDHVKSLGQTAVAITDHGVMYGVIDFYKAAKAAGVKPIIGCEVYVAPRTRFDKTHDFDHERYHLVLLCENEAGYQNLIKMVSASFVDGFYTKPRVDKALLKQYSGGLIALSACLSGEVQRAILSHDFDRAASAAKFYSDTFGEDNFYLEMQDHGLPDQQIVNAGLLRLSKEMKLPLVCSNDAHYLAPEDAEAQDVLMCIQMGKTVEDTQRMSFTGGEFYVKSGDEMAALFPEYPEALANTVEIARRCTVEFEFGKQHLPHFDLPKDQPDALSYLRKLCKEGFEFRYPDPPEGYEDRLDYELNMITQMGYVDYFLIVSDFIDYARRQHIPVGPGRGSAAGSMVSYCLKITDVEPMRYGLYFERFLNPERISMPDIDIDFCVKRRQEVIDYVVDKYGTDHVAQIVTFGTMAARGAVRDVGRAMNYPYAEVDVVAKQIPFAINMTLTQALKVSPQLADYYNNDPRIEKLLNMAKKVEGLPRHASTHAAGVLITAKPVDNYVPLALNDESVVTQFPMNTLEELGLLKMDFLGLRNLTILHDAVARIAKSRPGFALSSIPEEDKETFDMLSAGKTAGVFQLESSGMTGVCVGLKPQSIEDITAVVALYRPGPMDSIPRFIESKHNPHKVRYKHPMLQKTLEVTYGCIVYQEQVLEILRQMGGFTLGHADVVRKAMSKKKLKELARERQNFLDGALKNGVPEGVAQSIFDEIMDFANYAFNKAHAVCYAVIAYQTAYLKCHYPREYMAALLTSVLDSMGKVAEYIAATRDMGIPVLPPDINQSQDVFSADENGIRFGLAAIKNIGQGFINALLAEREAHGPFTSLHSFCERTLHLDLNRRALESLINCGAMDSFGHRNQLRQVYEVELESALQSRKRNLEGQMGLFGTQSLSSQAVPLPNMPEYSLTELLRLEKETCGLYFSGHPMDQYKQEIRACRAIALSRLLLDAEEHTGEFKDNQLVTVAGLIAHVSTKTTRNNAMMAYVTLEDTTSAMELLVFSNVLKRDGSYISNGALVCVKGKYSTREDKEPQIVVNEVRPLGHFTEMAHSGEQEAVDISMVGNPSDSGNTADTPSQATAVTAPPVQKLFLRIPGEQPHLLKRVKAMLSFFPGEVPVILKEETTGKRFGGTCDPTALLVTRLQLVLGAANVVVKE